jgi:hypothetical protein
MTYVQTQRGGRVVRKMLLVLALAMAIMLPATAAGASCLKGPAQGAKTTRMAATGKRHVHVRSHRTRDWMEFGRKVG